MRCTHRDFNRKIAYNTQKQPLFKCLRISYAKILVYGKWMENRFFELFFFALSQSFDQAKVLLQSKSSTLIQNVLTSMDETKVNQKK